MPLKIPRCIFSSERFRGLSGPQLICNFYKDVLYISEINSDLFLFDYSLTHIKISAEKGNK